MEHTFLLVDPHRIIRECLHCLLVKHFPESSILQSSDGTEAMELAKASHPDFVVTETILPHLNGIFLTQELKVSCPDTKILVLSRQSSQSIVAQAFEAGVDGYMIKDEGFDEIVEAIHAINKGHQYISPGIKSRLQYDWRRSGEYLSQRTEIKLTKRERQILALIADGLSTQDIAHSLNRSEKTIYTYRSHLQHKLGVNSVADMTKFAIQEGITTL